MEKDTTSLPEVWVITGIGYDDQRRVLGICPDEENAQRGKAYYEESYDEVEIERWYQETFEERPFVWYGSFNLEIRPYAERENTYLIGSANMNVDKQFLAMTEDPATREDFNFRITTTVTQDGKKTISMYGTFHTTVEPPAGGYGSNLGKARREWLVEKINKKNVIKLVMPTFD